MIEILGGRLCAKALGCSWQWRDPARYWNLITLQEAGTRTLSMLFPKAACVLHSEWNSEVAHPADRKMHPMIDRVLHFWLTFEFLLAWVISSAEIRQLNIP